MLPYSLVDALIVGSATTVSVTFVIAFPVMVLIGRAILELAIQRDAFEHLSSTDMLSGVQNRRAFFERFESSEQAGLLILADIDRFKAINDTFGHLAGDEVIRGVGQTLRAIFADKSVVIGRIGGEEFAVFLPGVAFEDTPDPAERVRTAVEAMRLTMIDRPVTISLGVAAARPQRPSVEAYAAADRALYLAKAAGRNRIVRASEVGAWLGEERGSTLERSVKDLSPLEALAV